MRKRKSPPRLKSELYKELRPEIDLATLAQDIADFLEKPAGKSAHGKDFANILAAYLLQKCSVTDRKSGELRWLIERHPYEVASFLDQIRFNEFQELAGTPSADLQPKSLKEMAQALLKTPDQLSPSEDEPPPTKKKPRPRPKTESERARRRKHAKGRYEEARCRYRRGLIVRQFGTHAFPTLYPHEPTRPEGPCLDILFRGGSVRMAAQAGSLEDLFGMDRKRFPKLRGKRSGRNVVYDLRKFLKCIIYLLANPDGKEHWLPKGPQRDLVLRGIIARARRYSPKVGDMFAEKLRPYVP